MYGNQTRALLSKSGTPMPPSELMEYHIVPIVITSVISPTPYGPLRMSRVTKHRRSFWSQVTGLIIIRMSSIDV